jgi:hypothetical protein
MAKILTFPTDEIRRDVSALASGGSAEVIVFPGVRYERWNELADAQSRLQAASKKRSQDRQRDVLELAE